MDTYYGDPTGVPRDFGVEVYFPFEDAMDFIERFNLTLSPGLPPSGATVTEYVDFATGKKLVNFTAADFSVEEAAIATMYNVLVSNGYDKMIEPGFWNLPAGPDIPDDLLMPIGDFAQKYNCTPALASMYEATGGGPSAQQTNFTNIMTLTFLQSFSPGWIKVLLGMVDMYHIEGGNQLLYNAVADLLGDDVMVNSTVIASERTDSGVTVVASGTQGTKIITAKKLIMAIPPIRENLVPFDLDADEIELFSQPTYGRYGTAIISHPSLTDGVTLQNMPASAVEDPYAPFLDSPYVLSFSSYGNDTDLFSIGYSSCGSPYLLFPPAVAQMVAQQSLQDMANAGTIPNLDCKELTVLDWSDHGPGGYGVTADEMRAGWMSTLYGMQGQRSTWWTGNAIAIDYSTELWANNDILLEKMMADW